MISRRTLLKVSGMACALLFSGKRNAMADFLFRPKKESAPRHRENLFTDGQKALVGVCGSKPVERMISEAVAMIGGFERLALKGSTVLVKPNVVSGEPNPATTNPQVVHALVKILYARGASKVFVGDMSAFATLSTKRNMARNGIKKAAEEAGAEVVVFEDHGWVDVELPANIYIKRAYVTEWIFRPDIVINLPVIKTHRSASYSITLKNFIGCTHLRQRPYIVDSSHWEEIVAEFNAAYAPDLNIVDGTISMIERGPWEGTGAGTNLIMASGDRVGADVAGLGVIKSFGRWKPVVEKDVWEQKQVKRAIDMGVGRGKDSIRLVAGQGDEAFNGLMEKVREITGL